MVTKILVLVSNNIHAFPNSFVTASCFQPEILKIFSKITEITYRDKILILT